MAPQAPLVISPISQLQYAARFMDEFPLPWTSDQAKAAGGVFNAIAQAIASQDSVLQGALVYGFDACRLATATDTELDLFAEDFYGKALPRQPGESDASYRHRIQTGFFQPKVTRPAIIALLTALTGQVPRVIEPWNVAQTGAWDWPASGWDADSINTPSLWGDPSLRYQGFIETSLPAITPSQQAGPIWGWDLGAGWDVQTGVWWTVQDGVFLTDNILDALIENSKAFGVTVYRKYYPSVPMLQTAFRQIVPQGSLNLSESIQSGPYVIGANCSWNANVSIVKSSASYELVFSAPAPSNPRSVQVVVSSITANGGASIGVTQGSTSVNINIPSTYTGGLPIVGPNWETDVWLSNVTINSATLNFSAAAPAAAFVDLQFVGPANSGNQMLVGGQTTISLNAPLPPNSVVMVLPTYNTTCGVSVTTGCTIQLGTAVPNTGQHVYYAIVPIGNPA